MSFREGVKTINAVIKKLPRTPHSVIPSREVWLSLWGAFIGIGFTALLAYRWKFPMLLGPFGASSVLIYGAYKSPQAQLRNVLLGHFVLACIGVVIHDFFGATFWSIALGAIFNKLGKREYPIHWW